MSRLLVGRLIASGIFAVVIVAEVAVGGHKGGSVMATRRASQVRRASAAIPSWLTTSDLTDAQSVEEDAMTDRKADRHLTEQTAFRFPVDLMTWLREQAHREGRSMTAIVIDALEGYRRKR